jgi:hypothetical protein
MRRALEEPPFVLDGARVLRYSTLDPGPRGWGSSVVVSGVPMDAANLAGIAIAESLLEGTVYLLHCNERWETVSATILPDVEAAEREAASTYGDALPGWTEYRPLTDEERSEIQSTRAFLRDLAAEEFGG